MSRVVADSGGFDRSPFPLVTVDNRAGGGTPKGVAACKKAKTKAADAIKGAVMRETKGMANMERVQQLVMEALALT